MPSVLEVLVQLTFPGPPATQYLPKDFLLGFSTLSGLSMLTKGLLGVLRCIQPVMSQACRQFWVQLAKFKGLEESSPRSVGPRKNLTVLVSKVQTL